MSVLCQKNLLSSLTKRTCLLMVLTFSSITLSFLVFVTARDSFTRAFTMKVPRYILATSVRADTSSSLDQDTDHRLDFPLDTSPSTSPSAFNPLGYGITLSPLATMTQRYYQAIPTLNRNQVAELLRRGAGLEKISLPGGTTSWRENGVLYVPEHLINHTKSDLVDFHYADYEACVPFRPFQFFEGIVSKSVPFSERKIIAGPLAAMKATRKSLPLRACPDFPCVHRPHLDKLDDASAVIFNAQNVRGVAPKRRPDQIFIFYIYEPLSQFWIHLPSFHKKSANWTDAFNWTMSYHLDADILMPYGIIRPRPVPVVKDYNDILATKTGLAVIMSSHCKTFSKREEYVKELQKYIQVDVVGTCGLLKCSTSQDKECVLNITQQYKFFLAFENNMCDSYISEKFFRMFDTDVVLVTRGDNCYHRHVPPETFINTADFDTPRALAERLKYLDQYDQEYLNILKEKDKYFSSFETRERVGGTKLWVKSNWENVPMCEICQRLWNLDKYAKQYPDIGDWFDRRICYDPTDF